MTKNNVWVDVSIILPCPFFSGAAGCPQSSSSHVPQSSLVVHRGQNVSLPCNITSSSEITWYLLHSDQLLPLLRVVKAKIGGKYVIDYSINTSRITVTGNLKSGLVRLEIQAVEEEDSGLYFCSGVCEAKVHVSRGIHLKFDGKT